MNIVTLHYEHYRVHSWLIMLRAMPENFIDPRKL